MINLPTKWYSMSDVKPLPEEFNHSTQKVEGEQKLNNDLCFCFYAFTAFSSKRRLT